LKVDWLTRHPEFMTEDLKPDDLKQFRITVRLTEAELLALRAEAEKRGVTVGAALRLLIRALREIRP
jgi:hypothetical protein